MITPGTDGAVPASHQRNWMAELGERLIANGYPIIPVMPGAKCPGRYVKGEWRGYQDWSRHCDRQSKPFELGVWR